MVHQTLRSTLRGFRRRKAETLLLIATSILGSVGFAAALGFTYDYLTADTFYDPPAELYQLNDFAVYGDQSSLDSWTLGLLTPWARDNVPAVREAGRYRRCSSEYVTVGVETVESLEITCVESTLFSMLSFPVVAGDPVAALERPDGAVVTDAAALRLFGTADAVGRSIDVPERDTVRTYTVGAVVNQIPANNHIRFDIAKSWLSQRQSVQEQNTWQYVLLHPNADPDDVAASLTGHITGTIEDPYIREVSMLPFRKVYLQTDLVAQHHGNQLVIASIIVLGAILFAIAAFNLFGLRIARVAASGREIGTRFSTGAATSDIAMAAAVETLVPLPVTMAGVALLSVLVIPELNAFSPSGMNVGIRTMVGAAATAVAMHVFAALAVALWTRRRVTRLPVASLVADGGFGMAGRTAARKLVLGAQLMLLAVLLTGSSFIMAQFRYMTSIDRGHATPEIVYVELEDHSVRLAGERIAAAISGVAGVETVVPAAALPGMPGFGRTRYTFPVPGRAEETIVLASSLVDTAFVEWMDIPIVAGRNVRAASTDGVNEVLLNTTAVRRLGFANPEEAVGWRPNDALEVVGITDDFVHGSFHSAVEPMALITNPRAYWHGLAVVPSSALDAGLLSRIRAATSAIVPAPLFSMRHYADSMQEMYLEETRLRRAMTWIGRAALLLVVAGLWSISAFVASRREREFSIRRVLGAGDVHVLGLHVRQFVVLVVPAFVLGAAAGYLLISRWLDNFAFRSDAVVGPFAAAAMVLVSVTLFAVVTSSIRFLTREPIEVLRAD